MSNFSICFPIVPIIPCGGSGTRLWPLSRSDCPKPFAVSHGGKTLFEHTVARALGLWGALPPLLVANQAHRHLLKGRGGTGEETILLEPCGRNTAPAIACAALHVAQTSPQHIAVVMPADHYVENSAAFNDAISLAARVAASGWIVVLGVVPNHPSTAFGYICPGAVCSPDGKAFKVDRFVEKPDQDRARQLFSKGLRWNAGLVVARVDTLIAAFEKQEPDLLEICRESLKYAHREGNCLHLSPRFFPACTSISFDHAILEHHDRVAMVEYGGSWNDLGTWREYCELISPDCDGNRVVGEVTTRKVGNSLILGSTRRTVVLGLRDAIVVDTPDALLIADRSALDDLRSVVEEIISQDSKVG